MGERFTPEDAGYILYSDVIERLRARFPTVADWRLEQIVTAENEAITGGMLSIVPAEVESGAIEMLSLEQDRMTDEGEVA
ncbi:hypothetical protein [Microbacterium sp. 1.5R]|uniref:hypothetical protein n=1 Tax=Microbacterium sp. 1.5R TaxID=1916917 RepID=UPI0011A7DC94|nr:hypothetical protein [Microbacterium sp. 1.5R]